MCRLCDAGNPQFHAGPFSGARRDFLKSAAATGAAVGAVNAGIELLAPRQARADDDDEPPQGSGRAGRRVLIRGGAVLTMDPRGPDLPVGDVLIEGKKIVQIGRNLSAGGAAVIDARGKIVMPGFIDTHHHQFETALRSFLPDAVLENFRQNPRDVFNYYEKILLTFAPVYRPQDVYINVLFGSLSQLDAGVTTVHDISQIHHTPEHSDAVVKAMADSGRRGVFGFFEGNQNGSFARFAYPGDAVRLKKQFFASNDQLLTMSMGGEIYLGEDVRKASWSIGRSLGLQIVAHIVGPFGMKDSFKALETQFGPDNLFIHVTGMEASSWNAIAKMGARVSLAVPIEMNMRHGVPPILEALSRGIKPSLSSDVECTLTADPFTLMRSTIAYQRALLNQHELGGAPGVPAFPEGGPFPADRIPVEPTRLRSRDVIEFATLQGAKDLRLDTKVGSLTVGKEADIVILDAEAINVAPLNHVPGAVVTLMERSNVETVLVAGQIRKWKGRLQGVNLNRLRRELTESRDYLFNAAGIQQDIFRDYEKP